MEKLIKFRENWGQEDIWPAVVTWAFLIPALLGRQRQEGGQPGLHNKTLVSKIKRREGKEEEGREKGKGRERMYGPEVRNTPTGVS